MSTAIRLAALSLTATTALALTACGENGGEEASPTPTPTRVETSTGATDADTTTTLDSETSDAATTFPTTEALTEVEGRKFISQNGEGYAVRFAEGTVCYLIGDTLSGVPGFWCSFDFGDLMVPTDDSWVDRDGDGYGQASAIEFSTAEGFHPATAWEGPTPPYDATDRDAQLNPGEQVEIWSFVFSQTAPGTITVTHKLSGHSFTIDGSEFTSSSWSPDGSGAGSQAAAGGSLHPEDFRVSPTAFTVISADDRVNCLVNTSDSGNGIYCATWFDPPLFGHSELTDQEEEFDSFLLDDDGAFRPYYASSSLSLEDGKQLQPGESVTILGTTFSQLDDVTFETVNGDARATVTDGAFHTGAR